MLPLFNNVHGYNFIKSRMNKLTLAWSRGMTSYYSPPVVKVIQQAVKLKSHGKKLFKSLFWLI